MKLEHIGWFVLRMHAQRVDLSSSQPMFDGYNPICSPMLLEVEWCTLDERVRTTNAMH